MRKKITDYKAECLYGAILLIVVLTHSTTSIGMIIRGACIAILWALPYFLNLKFKIINTLILAISIQVISAQLFSISNPSPRGLTVILPLMLYLALISNIFLVIRQMYQLKEINDKNRNGLKLLYVVIAFALLIGTVIVSYAFMYHNIWANNKDAFSGNNSGFFTAFYYSSTTYFTVGYGDITPKNDFARIVSMSQMFFGYMITCLILPTVLVAFQKLFQKEEK